MTFPNNWDTLYHMEKYKLIEKKVFSYIEKQELLCQGDKVIVGVSGGADSVCLLFVLLEYARQKDLELTVVHIHHGLRAEADQDAAYVEAVCKEHGLAFSLIKVDVKKEAEEFSCSEEEAGRNLRYRAFTKVAEEMHADKIAVAHNANDRAETFLFHLFRGSDLKGLGSIRPKRDRIIRPLLVLERAEIEEYLAERGIAYCQDSTNAQDTYTRNRIRHHILPYAEENIVQGCVSHIARTAEVLDETEQFLAQQTMEAYARCVEEREDSDAKYFLRIEPFRQLHPLLQKRVLYLVISALAGEAKDLSHVHVEAVDEVSAVTVLLLLMRPKRSLKNSGMQFRSVMELMTTELGSCGVFSSSFSLFSCFCSSLLFSFSCTLTSDNELELE